MINVWNVSMSGHLLLRPVWLVRISASRWLQLKAAKMELISSPLSIITPHVNLSASRRLQLKAEKMELIWFGLRSMLRHLTSDNHSLSINSVVVKSVVVVWDLGLLLDSELTMKSHVVSIGYYHLRRLRLLCCHITQDAMKQLVCSLILSRIDYCNSIVIGLPVSSIAPLQCLQNAATWLVMGLCTRDDVTFVLAGLHWLPILYRISTESRS